MLDNLSTDHENFLDILLLLGKYDIHLNNHLKTIIKKLMNQEIRKEVDSLHLFLRPQ
jgi:hypothetical protein